MIALLVKGDSFTCTKGDRWIVDRGVMIGAGAVILLVVFLLAKPFTEVIGASS